MSHIEKQKTKYQRFNIPGHSHELTFSCFRRRPFLKGENAKRFLVDAISAARIKYQFHIWAWVFMPEHVHLLIFPRLEEYSISAILKAIKQPTAQKMVRLLKDQNPNALRNLETGLANPRYRFWQDGGGYDRNYWTTKEILKQRDYIHNNPVRRGLVQTSVDWTWSSAREWLLGEPSPIRIDRDSFPAF